MVHRLTRLMWRALKTALVNHLEQLLQRTQIHIALEFVGWLASAEHVLGARLLALLAVQDGALERHGLLPLPRPLTEAIGMLRKLVEQILAEAASGQGFVGPLASVVILFVGSRTRRLPLQLLPVVLETSQPVLLAQLALAHHLGVVGGQAVELHPTPSTAVLLAARVVSPDSGRYPVVGF